MHTHDYEMNPDNTMACDLISRSTNVDIVRNGVSLNVGDARERNRNA